MPEIVFKNGCRSAGDGGSWGSAEFASARQYFHARRRFEIDCVGLWHAIRRDTPCTIIDVRTPRSFAAGRIPGALNIPLDALDPYAVAALPAAPLFVCDAGCRNDAYEAAFRLVECGREARVVSGGVSAWQAEGLELELAATRPDRMWAV